MMHANNQVTVKPQVEQQHVFTYVDVHSLLLVGKILLGEYMKIPINNNNNVIILSQI